MSGDERLKLLDNKEVVSGWCLAAGGKGQVCPSGEISANALAKGALSREI